MLPKASSCWSSRQSAETSIRQSRDILAVVIARGQPQHLDHAGRGRARSGSCVRCEMRMRIADDRGQMSRRAKDRSAEVQHSAGSPCLSSVAPAYIRYCSVMAAPSRLLSAMNSLMNSCRPLLENLLHAAVLEPGADGARLALGRALAAIGAGDVVEIEHEVLVAARERARHLVPQDQQVGDQPRLDALAIDPVIGGERRHRAQDRRPLEIIERAADPLVRRQQHVILHVEDARGVVGALHVDAEAGEPVGVVAQHGAVGGAVEAQRGFLHPAQEAHELLARGRAVAEALELEPGAVDGVPHLDRERGAHGARIGARDLEAVADRGGIGGGEAEEIGDGLLVRFRIGGGEGVGAAGGRDRRFPFVASTRHRRAAAW